MGFILFFYIQQDDCDCLKISYNRVCVFFKENMLVSTDNACFALFIFA